MHVIGITNALVCECECVSALCPLVVTNQIYACGDNSAHQLGTGDGKVRMLSAGATGTVGTTMTVPVFANSSSHAMEMNHSMMQCIGI